MRFQPIFVAVLIATSLIVAALIINSKRPAIETDQPTAAHVTATGKCANCHRMTASAVVHEYEMSEHAVHGVSCLDCHQATEGQDEVDHNGFIIATDLTAKNCATCHQLFGVGEKVGPDITGSNRADLSYILENVVDSVHRIHC